MATRYYFERNSDEELITFTADFALNGVFGKTSLVLDTGATYSVFDLNVLLLHQFDPKQVSHRVPIQTAGGRIEALLTELPMLSCLGYERKSFPVMAYDFLLFGSAEPYGGILGLDFLDSLQMVFDFKHNFVESLTISNNFLTENAVLKEKIAGLEEQVRFLYQIHLFSTQFLSRHLLENQ